MIKPGIVQTTHRWFCSGCLKFLLCFGLWEYVVCLLVMLYPAQKENTHVLFIRWKPVTQLPVECNLKIWFGTQNIGSYSKQVTHCLIQRSPSYTSGCLTSIKATNGVFNLPSLPDNWFDPWIKIWMTSPRGIHDEEEFNTCIRVNGLLSPGKW